METDTEMGRMYQKICYENKVLAHKSILSRFNDACVRYGELNLSQTKITESSFSCITETLRRVPTIHVLNLSDCVLSLDGLKNFLDALNELPNLSHLNLKGNKIGNLLTAYLSKAFLNNTSIAELHLNWNHIGDSVETFSQLCQSLMFNAILNTLNLANNNLCDDCSFHFAKMLSKNKSLKKVDLSWNHIGETGAKLLLECLKNNDTLLELNIRCNSISQVTSAMIAEQLKQNQLVKTNKNEIHLNCLNNQHKKQIDSLESKFHQLQIENKQQKQELEELKNNCLKDNSNNSEVVEKLKSELLSEKQSLRLIVEKISNDLPHSDQEDISSLKDLEKITCVIENIKTKYERKVLEESKVKKTLFDTLPILTNGLNIVKKELKTMKTLMEMEIKTYLDELTAIKNNLSFHLKLSHKNDNESMHKMFYELELKQQNGIHISIEQTKMLLLLSLSLKKLYHENIDLEIKLSKAEAELVVSFHKKQALENDLKLAQEEIQNLKDEQLSNEVIQDTNTKINIDKLEKLLDSLIEKEQQLKLCKMEKEQLNNSHITEVSSLKEQLRAEKQKFKKQK